MCWAKPRERGHGRAAAGWPGVVRRRLQRKEPSPRRTVAEHDRDHLGARRRTPATGAPSGDRDHDRDARRHGADRSQGDRVTSSTERARLRERDGARRRSATRRGPQAVGASLTGLGAEHDLPLQGRGATNAGGTTFGADQTLHDGAAASRRSRRSSSRTRVGARATRVRARSAAPKGHSAGGARRWARRSRSRSTRRPRSRSRSPSGSAGARSTASASPRRAATAGRRQLHADAHARRRWS